MVSGGTTPKNTQLNGSSQKGPLSSPPAPLPENETSFLANKNNPGENVVFFQTEPLLSLGQQQPTRFLAFLSLLLYLFSSFDPAIKRPNGLGSSFWRGEGFSERKEKEATFKKLVFVVTCVHGDSSTPRMRIGESLPYGASSSTAHFPTTASPPTYYLFLLLFSRQYIFPNGPLPSSAAGRERSER